MLRTFIAISAALLLGACASTPVLTPSAPAPLETNKEARELAHWQAKGKVSIRFLGQSITATYRWQRQSDDFSADAAGPLNQGYTTLASQQGIVTLENAWLGRHESADGEGLLQAVTSIRVPLSHFNAWFMGWPKDPSTPIQMLDGTTGTREFSEYGWQIRISSEQIVDGYRIPERMIVSQDGTRLVISLNEWTPLANASSTTPVQAP